MMLTFRRWLWILALTLCSLSGLPQTGNSAQVIRADTSTVYSEEESEREAAEGADYGLGLMLLFFLLIMAVSAVAMVILLALVVLIVALLIAWGVLGISLLVGAYKNSFRKGFRVFWILGSAFSTAFVGALLAFLVHLAFDPTPALHTLVLWGFAAGFVGGGLFGFVTFQLLQYVFSRIVAYFQSKKKTT